MLAQTEPAIQLRPISARVGGARTRVFFIVRGDERIGSCEITVDENGAGVLDCWVLPTHRRRGAATLALGALMRLATREWGLRRLRARVPDGDGPAARLLRRLGFV